MLNISRDTTRRALLILTWPLFQLLFLRLFLHEFLQLRFGFGDITDFDLLLPAPIAFVVLMHALEQAQDCELRFQKWPTIVNVIALGLFLLVNNFYEDLNAINAVGSVSLWFALLGTMIASAFCVVVKPRYYLKNANSFAFLPCSLIAGSLFFYTNGFHEGWTVLGSMTSVSLYGIFKLIPFTDAICFFNGNSEVALEHPLFTASIGKACGGFESFFFFTLVYLLAHTLQSKKIGALKSLSVYSGGIFLMFVLNLFRIVFLFYTAIGLKQILPPKLAINIFKLCFHANFGWILYTAGIFSYLKSWSPFLQRDEDTNLRSLIPVPVRERA